MVGAKDGSVALLVWPASGVIGLSRVEKPEGRPLGGDTRPRHRTLVGR